MNFLRHGYLGAPVLVLVILFLLDKIFLFPEVRDEFIQPGGMHYYRQRRDQIGTLRRELKKRRPGNRYAVVFGDSRSFALGDRMARIAGVKNMTLYNFAGPQALPAYHAYLAGRIFKGLNRPDYLLLGLSPDAFNRNAGIFARPVLAYGVDQDFIDENQKLIEPAVLEAYRDTRRFALPGMQFSMKTLFRRIRGSLKSDDDRLRQMQALLQNPEATRLPGDRQNLQFVLQLALEASAHRLSHYRLKRSPQTFILESEKGAQYRWWGAAPDSVLKKNTRHLVQLYMKNFSVSETQFRFLEQTLQRSRLAGVKTLVFRPRVNRYLLAAYRREPAIDAIWKRVEALSRRNGADVVDLNKVPSTACSQFYDASHMSISCFPPITAYLLGRIQKSR